MVDIIYIILLCVGASFIQRTTGFGFGIFIMTMLPYFTPSLGEATTLSGLLALTTSLFIAIRMRKYIVWKRLLPVLFIFIIASSISICFLKSINEQLLRLILGIVLILSSIYFFVFSERIHIKANIPTQIGIGSLSGVMGGFFGMQGPPAVLYFISSEPDKEHYMGIIQAFFLFGNGAMTIIRALNGYLTHSVLTDYLFGLIGISIGTLIGSIVFKYIPTKIFKYIVYGYIGVSGVIVLYNSIA